MPWRRPDDGHCRVRPLHRRGGLRAVRPRHGARGARGAQHRDEDVLRLRQRLRRRAQHQRLPGVPGPAGLAAAAQRARPSSPRQDRPGAELPGPGALPASPGRTTSTRTCRRTSRSFQYEDPIVFDGYLDVPLDDGATWRVGIERAHMEEDTGKSLHVGGATGRIHGADYSLLDYNRSGVPLIEIVTKPIIGAGVRAPEVARAYVDGAARRPARARGLRRPRWIRARCAATPTCSLMPKGRDGVRHPHRDQERQLAALGGARGALRDGPPRRRAALRRHHPAGDPALRRAVGDHLAGPAEGDLRRLPLLPRARPPAAGALARLGGDAARRPARAPRGSAARASRPSGTSRTRSCATWSTPTRSTSSPTPSTPARRRRPPARWWVSYLSQQANAAGTALTALAITPAQVARVVALVERGHADQQAGAPGRRRRPRGRGRARRRGHRAGSRGGQRRERADRRGGRGAGGPAGRGREESARARPRRPARSSAR